MTPHEQAEALYEALATGDADALDRLLHKDFRGRVADGMPFGMGGEHKGVAAMRDDVWWTIGKHFRVRAVPEAMTVDADGKLIVTGRYRGTARSTGNEVDAALVHILEFADGRISALTQLTDTQRWCAALQAEPRAKYVELELEDGLATLTLNRVDANNAINQDLVDDLHDAVLTLPAMPELRALLIRANGAAFTPGGDIKVFASVAPEALADTILPMIRPFHAALHELSKLDVPVVAAVHGSAAGGGLGIALVADVVIAAEGTKFATGFAHIGLTGDGGCSYFLPRLVGTRRAFELYYDNRVLDAAEALEWGLISKVVAPDELTRTAADYARKLADGPTKSYAGMRGLLRGSPTATLEQQLRSEYEAMGRSARTTDAADAMRSFVAKQRPTFRGR